MRILVVDDHEVVRQGVISLLRRRPDWKVVGEASGGNEGVARARELRPDVVVMDISLPDMNGLEATRLIREQFPECEVLILSQHDTLEMVRQAFKAGARGYVIKSSLSKNLMAAVEKVSHHEAYFDPAISEVTTPLDVQEVLQRATALQEALLESEQLYRNTFERAAVGVAHVAPDGRWIRVNRRVCEITGYSEAELLQLRFQDMTHPDDLAADLAETEKLRTGELSNFSIEKRYRRKDGSWVWVQLSVSCARDSRGRLKHFISVVEDISDRRDAKRAQARLAAIVESSDDAIISKDLNGIITSWNAGASRIFGFTPEETIGKPITILIPLELHAEETSILQRLRRGERIDHFETIRVTKSGERRNISLSISPLRNSQGRVVGASKIARDITEKKRIEEAKTRAEEALRESQTQLALALEASRTAIFDWDIEREQGKWNEQMANLYDFDPGHDHITAEQWRSLFHPGDVQRLTDEFAATLKNANKFQFEFRAIRPDGCIRWILSHGRIVRDATGKAVRLIGTHTDITDRKQAEEIAVLREITGKLLHVQDAERRRIARELHDSSGQIVAALQMNLVPMQATAQRKSPELAEGIRQSLELIDQLSKELRTVSYLLHPPLLDELGLPSALRWYVDGFAERSKVEVDLELPSDLGRLPADMETTIFRIIQESLTNIHRHSGSKKASIRLIRSSHDICLEVKDFGSGMPRHRTNGSSRQKASGVGIQGMRERVRQLSGTFHIESSESGTTVTARFPTAVPALAYA